MPELPGGPSPNPAKMPDGRPFLAGIIVYGCALWLPSPRREGDPAYSHGLCIGTFRGVDLPGQWYIELVRSRDMPPGLAKHFGLTR